MFAGIGSGIWHQEFYLITSSWSFGECVGVWNRGDVNLATHNFVHLGGLGDCPAGFEGIQLQPGDKRRGAAGSTSPAVCGVQSVSVPSSESQTGTAGKGTIRWQHTP